jgi:hypothetical protein
MGLWSLYVIEWLNRAIVRHFLPELGLLESVMIRPQKTLDCQYQYGILVASSAV